MKNKISANKYRSHHCNEINLEHVGNEVRIAGWVHNKRDHGDLLFIDLRDHYGITQCVIEAKDSDKIKEFSHIKLESVILVTGKVVARDKEAINPNIATGQIEVVIKTLEVDSHAKQIPFQINADHNYPEDLRLKYRFLDLRKQENHDKIILRSKIIKSIRDRMYDLGFLEIQTPILTASSPEGARDFLVPSRLHHGKFYALPQAPQQFKQLLMASGFDKYFQIAPCFRDEDARSDRSPGEFYQLDMEMAFATQQDVFAIIEQVVPELFREFSDLKISDNIPHITYDESMLKYGNDKPDLRNPIIISDVTDIFADSGFSIFASNIKNKSCVARAIPAPKTANMPRSFFDNMIKFATDLGAGGLAYIIFADNGEVKSPIAKLLTEEKINEIKTRCNLSNGDAVFFTCEKEKLACGIGSKVRDKLGRDLELIDNNLFQFCWIVDFPYYEYDDEKKKIDFSHNPFSMPQGGLEALENSDPLKIKAYQYDFVCNGVELSSGAIRNHKPEVMYKAFAIAGYNKEQVETKFGALLRAFEYGAPPHGGIAPGIDRMVMLIAGTENIREITPFPMNGQAEDLLMNAPSEVLPEQLKELNIKIVEKINK